MKGKPASPTIKETKPGSLGSARKEGKAVRATPAAGRRLLHGIHTTKSTKSLEATKRAKKSPPRPEKAVAGKVAVAAPDVPGSVTFVDAAKYGAMKDILLAVIPSKRPGFTQGELFDAVRLKATKTHFPGSTDRWWAKCVQLDLEAKGVLRRVDGTPVRWYRTQGW